MTQDRLNNLMPLEIAVALKKITIYYHFLLAKVSESK